MSYLSAIGPLGLVLVYQLYQSKASEIDTTIFELNNQVKALETQLSEKSNQLEAFQDHNNLISTQDNKDHKDKINGLNKEIEQLKTSNDSLNDKIVQLTKTINDNETISRKYQEELSFLKEKIKLLEIDKNKLDLDYKIKLNNKIEELITEKDLKIEYLNKAINDITNDRDGNLDLHVKLIEKSEKEIRKYEQDLLSANNKLQTSSKTIEQLEIDKTLLSDKIKDIETETEKMVELKKLEIEVADLKKTLKIEDLNEINQKLNDFDSLKSKYKEIEDSNKSTIDELSDLKNEYDILDNKFNELTLKYDELNEVHLLKSSSQIEQDHEELVELIQKVFKETENIVDEAFPDCPSPQDKVQKIADSLSKIEELKANLDAKDHTITTMNTKNAKLSEEIEVLENEHRKKISEIEKLDQEIKRMEDNENEEIASLKTTISKLETDHKAISETNQSLEASNKELKEKIDETNKTNKQLLQARDVLDNMIITEDSKKKSLLDEIESLKQQLQESKEKADKEETQRINSETELSEIKQQLEGKNKIIQQLEKVLHT
ncbi:hypothetical protein CLIB1444_05S01486 [[Candida] jaroonii]|uniref:Uncharacterized protein n=1 Tax=[Candida] jaroonii TaxID=467808 RepID=A0ACA9Y8G5_9ASCO|nr:hypothetical protein CLIB1444_05S01486 [[Candida] jaroonii]